MTPKRNAQHAGLDAAAHPDPGPQLRRSPRNLSVEESVASPSPLAKRLRGRSSKNAPPAELQVKKAVAKGPANESIANDDAEKDLNGMEDDAYSEHSVDTEDGNDTETSAPDSSDAYGVPGAHPAYKDIPSRDAVVFLFSKAFQHALETKADSCVREHGISAEEAVEEFRRLLAIKTWTMDVDATQNSSTAIMDDIWHAAVLDTEFHAKLQSTVGVKLCQSPKDRSDEDIENLKKR